MVEEVASCSQLALLAFSVGIVAGAVCVCVVVQPHLRAQERKEK